MEMEDNESEDEEYYSDNEEDSDRPDQISAVIDNDLERLKKLLESGLSPNEVDKTHCDYTSLHYSVINRNEEIFNYLLTLQDVQINVKNRDGMTPLLIAVHHNHEDFVQKLINRGADLNIQDNYGNTPLHYAVGKSLPMAVSFIDRKADLNSQNTAGETPLFVACKKEEWDFVHTLLYYGADAMICSSNGLMPFVCCLWHSPPGDLEILINYSFDQVKAGIELNTLLEIMKTDSPIFYKIVEKNSHILYTEEDLNDRRCKNMLLDVKGNMLKILLDKFPKFFDNFFEVYDMPISVCSEKKISNLIQCFYVLCESRYISIIMDKFLHVLALLKQVTKLPEDTVIEFVCCLLSYGFCPIRCNDLNWAYRYYGFGNLFKILLHMDIADYNSNRDYENLRYTFFPRIIYDVSLSFDDFLKIPEALQTLPGTDVLIHMRKFFTLDRNTSVPSLRELSREMTRKYIIQTYKIKNNVQYFTVVKHLKLGNVYKSIITYEKEIY